MPRVFFQSLENAGSRGYRFSRSLTPIILLVILWPFVSYGQNTCKWESAAGSGLWTVSGENRWYRWTDKWQVQRPDLAWNVNSITGTRCANVIQFEYGTANYPDMTVNNVGGAEYIIHELKIWDSVSRSFNRNEGTYDGAYILMTNYGSTTAKIIAQNGNGASLTFNIPVTLAGATELNAEQGNLYFNDYITNNVRIDVLSGSGKSVYINGTVSGVGGITMKGSGYLYLNGTNTYTGTNVIQTGMLRINADRNLGAIPSGVVTNQITITNSAVFQATSSLTLDSKRGITLNGDGVLSVDSGQTLTYSGIIAEGASGKALVKNGAGTLTLGGANTFMGNLYINAGRVVVTNADPFDMNYLDVCAESGSDSAALFLGNGVTLDNKVTIRFGSSGTAMIGADVTGTALISADVQIKKPLIVSNVTGNTLTFRNIYQTNDLDVIKQGGGTMTLYTNSFKYLTNQAGIVKLACHDGWHDWNRMALASGSTWDLNGFTGLVACVEGDGTVDLSTGGVLRIASASGSTMSGIITGTGSVIKAGSDVWTLAGVNTFIGTSLIEAGTLRISADRNLGAVPATSSKNVDMWAGSTLEADGTFILDGNRQIFVGSSSGPKISVTEGNTLTCAGLVTGSAGWSKESAGQLTLTNANTFSGALSINSGVVQIRHANGLGTVAGATTVATGAALELVSTGTTAAEPLTLSGTGISGGGALRNVTGANTFAGAVTLASDVLITNASSTVAGLILSGSVACGGNTLYIGSGSGGSRYVYLTGSITGDKTTGDGAVVFCGESYFQLSGVNTGLTGDVRLNAGEIRLSGNRSLTSGGNVIMAGGTALKSSSDTARYVTNNLTLNGDVTFGAAGSQTGNLTIDGTMNLAGNVRTLAVDQPAANRYTELKGVISNGGLTKSGAGLLILSGANTYAGGTTISAGTLQLGNNGSSGSIVGNVTDNGVLAFRRNNELTFSGIISGTGSVSQLGSSTLILNGENTYEGGTVISNGTLQISSDGNLGKNTGRITLGNNASLQVTTDGLSLSSGRTLVIADGHVSIDGGCEVFYGGTITGTGRLYKTGQGQLNLSGNSDYTGKTEIRDGTLAIGADCNLGTPPELYTADALAFTENDYKTLLVTNSFELNILRGIQLARHAIIGISEGVSFTNNGIISESESEKDLSKQGAGTLSLSGTNTFTGHLYVDEGALELGGCHPLAASEVDIGMESETLTACLYAKNGLTNDAYVKFRAGSTAMHILGMREAGSALFRDTIGVYQTMAVSNVANSTLHVYSMWQAGGDKTLCKLGAGTFVLYTNNIKHITNEVGTLRAGSDSGWFNWTHVYLADDATFELSGHTVTQQWVDGCGKVKLRDGHLVIDGGAGATFDGVISETGRVTKSGTGQWTLNGVNTYQGSTYVEGGSLAISQDANLGAVPSVTTADSLNLGNWGALSVTNALELNPKRGITLHAGAGGIIEVADDVDFTNSSIVAGARWLSKTGAGRMLLTATNTYSGGTIISGGVVHVTLDDNLGAKPSTPQVNIMLADWSTLQFTAPGTVTDITLDENRTITNRNGGHLRVDGEGTNLNYAGKITGSGQLNITGGGRVNLMGVSDYTGKTEIQWGSLAIGNDRNLGLPPETATPGHLAFNEHDWSHLYITNSMILDSRRGISLSNVNAIIEVSNAEDVLAYNGVIDGTDHGGALAKRGEGGLILGGESLFTNNLYVDEGSLKLTAAAPAVPLASSWIDLGATNNVTVSSSPSASLVLGAGVTIGNMIHARTNAYAASGARYIVMEDTGSAGVTGSVRVSDTLTLSTVSGSILTFSGNFWQNETNEYTSHQRIHKIGDGTVVLNNTNNWFKYLNVDDGTVQSAVNGALWSWSDLIIANGAKYDMNDKNLQVAVLSGAGELDLGAGNMTIFNGYDNIFYGKITGTGNLVKEGDDWGDWGRQALYAANEYSGTTMIYYGTLWVDNQTNLGSGNLEFKNNGRLWLRENSVFDSSRAVKLAGAGNIEVYNEKTAEIRGLITGSGNLSKGDGGTLVLTNDNTMSGSVYINKGTLSVPRIATAASNQPLGQRSDGSPHVYLGSAGEQGRLLYTGAGGSTTKNFNFPANATGVISIAGGATLTNAPGSVITGPGVFRKQGAGTLFFNQTVANTLSGPVYVDAGTLRVRRAGALGAVTQTVVEAGASLEIDSDGANYVFQTGVLRLYGHGVDGSGALRMLQNRANNSLTNDIVLATDSAIFYSGASEAFYITNSTVSGNGRLTKLGAGLIHLDGINTYSGGTTVSNGTIRFMRTENLGAEPAGFDADHLVLNGGALQKTDAGSMTATLSTNRGITIGAAGGTISVNSADRTLQLEAPLTGTGALTKDLAGVLRLDADSSSTYNGAITVSGGTLEVRGTVDKSAVTVTNAALTGAGSVGVLTVNGGGTVRPGNTATETATLNCSGLVLKDGAALTIPVSSGDGATNGMICVTGNMTLPAQSEQITVNLSYVGSGTNFFRSIPFLYFSGDTHTIPHTNWNVTGVPTSLKPFMKVGYIPGSGTYYVEGATPYCEITNAAQNAADALEISIQVDTVEGLDYDLIYFDAVTYPSGSGASSVNWQKLYSVTASGTSTTFTNDLTTLAVGYLRFMRVSPLGAWQNEPGSKFASRQVYVAKKAVLYPGRNWVALPGLPISPTVSNVFGYGLPAGVDTVSSTWIDLYNTGNTISPTGTFWLAGSTPPHWQWSLGGSGSADQFELPTDQGFMVNLPGGAARYLALAGMLRTNEQQIVIAGGGAMTFVGVLLPGAMHPKDLGLVASGFTGADRMRPTRSDKIYIWDRMNQCLKTAYLWFNTTNSTWYWNDKQPQTALKDTDRPILQDDALIIYTGGAGYTWENPIYYTPPTSDMDP